MNEMDLRQYDPAIARWVAQDSVIHHEFSPYSAFDNNPVYWADPSGADAISNGGNSIDIEGLFNTSKDGDSYDFKNGSATKKTSRTEAEMQKFYEMAKSYLNGSDGGGNGNGGDGNGNGKTKKEKTKNENDMFSDINNSLALGALGIENSSYKFYIGTARRNAPVVFLGERYYGNGKWYAHIAPFGKFLGQTTFAIGFANDSYGVYINSKNPNSPDAVSPTKMSINTTMSALGFTGWGLPASITYGFLEVAHPQGALGAIKDYGTVQNIYRQNNNGAVFKPGL